LTSLPLPYQSRREVIKPVILEKVDLKIQGKYTLMILDAEISQSIERWKMEGTYTRNTQGWD
jgi:hypothetical protein